MTRARAPGKVVLSGAYAVLDGAPAVVSAVGRYVEVDSARPADWVTPEVQAALAERERAPWFDASALREGGRKLGLGSSAAILVASLYALERDALPDAGEPELRRRIFERALRAHRAAQGGGSGVDVASSCFGGTSSYRLGAAGPEVEALSVPRGLDLELWICPTAAGTADLIRAVASLASREPRTHERWMSEQALASERALQACTAGDAAAFVAALRAQRGALAQLGGAAGVPIVTPELLELSPSAEGEGGALLPAGAGGGDIALFAGSAPSSPALRAALEARGHRLLQAELGAAGVGAG